jgi:hypothetical protein
MECTLSKVAYQAADQRLGSTSSSLLETSRTYWDNDLRTAVRSFSATGLLVFSVSGIGWSGLEEGLWLPSPAGVIPSPLAHCPFEQLPIAKVMFEAVLWYNKDHDRLHVISQSQLLSLFDIRSSLDRVTLLERGVEVHSSATHPI